MSFAANKHGVLGRNDDKILFRYDDHRLAMSLAVYLTYNLTFVQHQGRYLFSALVPISIGVAVAWGALARPLVQRYRPAVFLLPLALAACLVALDLLALYRFIVPALELQ